MNFRAFSKLIVATSSAILIGACSGGAIDSVADGDDTSADEALKANVKPGVFRLYSKPHVTPDPACDLYTNLELKAGTYSTATLDDTVGRGGLGMRCEIAVAPNERTYRLKLASTKCGTRVYTGSRTRGGKHSEITITDNRAHVVSWTACKDVPKAKIVVEETQNGTTTTKYSHDFVGASCGNSTCGEGLVCCTTTMSRSACIPKGAMCAI